MVTWQQIQPYVLLAWPVVTALASLGYTALDKTTRGHAFLSTLASLGIDLPKLLDALRRLIAGGSSGGSASSGSVAPKPSTPGKPVALRIATMAVAFFAVMLSGCLSNTPIVPVTAANQEAVNSCVMSSNIHNGAVVGALVSGAVGTAAGAIAVADNDSAVKNAMGVTGATAAGLTAVGAGIIALENQLYQSGGCPQLTGPLPVLGRDGKPIARGFVPGDLPGPMVQAPEAER